MTTSSASDMPWWSEGDAPQIEFGTVGWVGEDKFYSVGTAEDDGHTLVRVQLFRGRNVSKPNLTPKIGQGHKLLCHIPSGMFRIPPKGTRVIVAVPFKMDKSPVGFIVSTVEQNPMLQYNDDRVHIGFGDDTHVVIRGKSVTITDPANRFIMVGESRAGGTPGVFVQDETGSGLGIAAGTVGAYAVDGSHNIVSFVQVKQTGVDIAYTGSSPVTMTLSAGQWWTIATSALITSSAVLLGARATVASPALWGPTGVGGLPSASVFISPT
jgi:hypothetical protein